MSAGESARKFYESARTELIDRIKLRDNVLLFYLGVTATLLGVAFGSKSTNKEILLVIPFIALSVSTHFPRIEIPDFPTFSSTRL